MITSERTVIVLGCLVFALKERVDTGRGDYMRMALDYGKSFKVKPSEIREVLQTNLCTLLADFSRK